MNRWNDRMIDERTLEEWMDGKHIQRHKQNYTFSYIDATHTQARVNQ